MNLSKLNLLVACFLLAASTPLFSQVELIAAPDGKAYSIDSESGEIVFLENGLATVVDFGNDLKTRLQEVVDDPNTTDEIKEFSLTLLQEFYSTSKVREYWVEEVSQ